MRRVLLTVFTLGLTACGGNSSQPSQFAAVDYTVSGTATKASMTYQTASGGTAQTGDLALPWTFNTTMRPGDFVYVSAQNGGQTGCVNVEIKVRKTVFKSTQSCGAFVIATASGTID